jgi:hypothetical protein
MIRRKATFQRESAAAQSDIRIPAKKNRAT